MRRLNAICPIGIFFLLQNTTTVSGQKIETFSNEGKSYITNLINKLRSQELAIPARGMYYVSWADKWAEDVKEGLETCLHGSRNDPFLSFVDIVADPTGTDSLEDFLQRAFYTWGQIERDILFLPLSNDILPGVGVGVGVYSNYSQLVWAKSREVGCAIAICGETRNIRCGFDVKGNTPDEAWYSYGRSGSNCPSNSVPLSAGLCRHNSVNVNDADFTGDNPNPFTQSNNGISTVSVDGVILPFATDNVEIALKSNPQASIFSGNLSTRYNIEGVISTLLLGLAVLCVLLRLLESFVIENKRTEERTASTDETVVLEEGRATPETKEVRTMLPTARKEKKPKSSKRTKTPQSPKSPPRTPKRVPGRSKSSRPVKRAALVVSAATKWKGKTRRNREDKPRRKKEEDIDEEEEFDFTSARTPKVRNESSKTTLSKKKSSSSSRMKKTALTRSKSSRTEEKIPSIITRSMSSKTETKKDKTKKKSPGIKWSELASP